VKAPARDAYLVSRALLAPAASAQVGHAGADVRLAGRETAVPVVRALEDQAVSLPPAAEALVAQLMHVLGVQTLNPLIIELHFDRGGVLQEIKPQLSFKRAQDQARGPECCGVPMKYAEMRADFYCLRCGRRIDRREHLRMKSGSKQP
jgi:predicted RNA-binding Zn-ribbon protein involved in translation (DUF1610 family)